MADRQVLEHRLAGLVEEWAQAREAKAAAVSEHNGIIKELEGMIDVVLASLRDVDSGQQRLPLEDAELERMAEFAKREGITGAQRNPDGSTTITIDPTRRGHV